MTDKKTTAQPPTLEDVNQRSADLARLRAEHRRAQAAAAAPWPDAAALAKAQSRIEQERADAFLERREPALAPLTKKVDELQKKRAAHDDVCATAAAAARALAEQIATAETALAAMQQARVTAALVAAKAKAADADRAVTAATAALTQAYAESFAAAWRADALAAAAGGRSGVGLAGAIEHDSRQVHLRTPHPSLGAWHPPVFDRMAAAAAPLIAQHRAELAAAGLVVGAVGPGTAQPRVVQRQPQAQPAPAPTQPTHVVRLADENGARIVDLTES